MSTENEVLRVERLSLVLGKEPHLQRQLAIPHMVTSVVIPVRFGRITENALDAVCSQNHPREILDPLLEENDTRVGKCSHELLYEPYGVLGVVLIF